MFAGGPPESSRQSPALAVTSLVDDADVEADTDTGRISLAPMSLRPSAETAGAMLTVMSGLHAGRVFVLDRGEVLIGRGREAHVQAEDNGVSRKHARLIKAANGNYRVEDLRSTNGVYVNGTRVTSLELQDGDRLQIGPSLLLRFSRPDQLEQDLALRLYDASTRDALTGLYNRKYFTSRVDAEVAFAERHRTPLGVILFDIDHFKKINDQFGHAAGDQVLRTVSARVLRSIRREDVVARWGGEEFALLLRGLDLRSLALFGERLRRGIEALDVAIEVPATIVKVTISVGVAALSELDAPAIDEEAEATDPGLTPNPPKTSRLEGLMGLADARLYSGKTGGRNRVVST